MNRGLLAGQLVQVCKERHPEAMQVGDVWGALDSFFPLFCPSGYQGGWHRCCLTLHSAGSLPSKNLQVLDCSLLGEDWGRAAHAFLCTRVHASGAAPLLCSSTLATASLGWTPRHARLSSARQRGSRWRFATTCWWGLMVPTAAHGRCCSSKTPTLRLVLCQLPLARLLGIGPRAKTGRAQKEGSCTIYLASVLLFGCCFSVCLATSITSGSCFLH